VKDDQLPGNGTTVGGTGSGRFGALLNDWPGIASLTGQPMPDCAADSSAGRHRRGVVTGGTSPPG